MLLAASETALGVMMAAMLVLWLISTIHHNRLAKTTAPSPTSHAPRAVEHTAAGTR
jgi:hypothetical protein